MTHLYLASIVVLARASFLCRKHIIFFAEYSCCIRTIFIVPWLVGKWIFLYWWCFPYFYFRYTLLIFLISRFTLPFTIAFVIIVVLTQHPQYQESKKATTEFSNCMLVSFIENFVYIKIEHMALSKLIEFNSIFYILQFPLNFVIFL